MALPMAVDLGIEVRYRPGEGPGLAVSSATLPGAFRLLWDGTVVPERRAQAGAGAEAGAGGAGAAAPEPGVPEWSRYVAAMVAVAPTLPVPDGELRIAGDLPVGAGLSSSAALCVAIALALGAPPDPMALAEREQAAEERAGVTVGLMDPLVIVGARTGHAVYLDFTTMARHPVPLPDGMEVVVVHSGAERDLRTSPYAARRAECLAAAQLVGPLGAASSDAVATIPDPVLRRRARHVVTECARVRAMIEALGAGDLARVGALLGESHRSLRDDFAASVPAVDQLVEVLTRTPGVHGARMTGGGFGGCVVACSEPGAVDVARWAGRAWRVTAAEGAGVRRAMPSGAGHAPLPALARRPRAS